MPKVKVNDSEMKSKRKKRLTLKRLLDDNDEIWVVNETGNPETGREAGNVSLQTGRGENYDRITVPAGNDPVCLTDQASLKSLRECNDLFRSIDRGGLRLLDPEVAEDYYEKNKKRRAVVDKKINAIRFKEKLSTEPIMDGNVAANRKKRVNSHVSTKLQSICVRAKRGEISETEALETLLEQENILKNDDFEYLRTNGVFGSIKNWAMDKLLEK